MLEKFIFYFIHHVERHVGVRFVSVTEFRPLPAFLDPIVGWLSLGFWNETSFFL